MSYPVIVYLYIIYITIRRYCVIIYTSHFLPLNFCLIYVRSWYTSFLLFYFLSSSILFQRILDYIGGFLIYNSDISIIEIFFNGYHIFWCFSKIFCIWLIYLICVWVFLFFISLVSSFPFVIFFSFVYFLFWGV